MSPTRDATKMTKTTSTPIRAAKLFPFRHVATQHSARGSGASPIGKPRYPAAMPKLQPTPGRGSTTGPNDDGRPPSMAHALAPGPRNAHASAARFARTALAHTRRLGRAAERRVRCGAPGEPPRGRRRRRSCGRPLAAPARAGRGYLRRRLRRRTRSPRCPRDACAWRNQQPAPPRRRRRPSSRHGRSTAPIRGRRGDQSSRPARSAGARCAKSR